MEFFVGMDHIGLFTSNLEDAMGIAQHHDAVSGTAKQHTTDDYSKRLALGASKVQNLSSIFTAMHSFIFSRKSRYISHSFRLRKVSTLL